MNKRVRRMWIIGLCGLPAWLPAIAGPSDDAAPPPSYLRRPLEESGRTDAYSYRRSEQHPGMMEVELTDQEGLPIYIDEETLNLVLSGPVPEGVKAAFISQYPHQMLAMFDTVVDTYYPEDPDVYADDPFQAWAGDRVTVTQDPRVAHYVRARVTDEQGRVEEFSLSRHSMDEILEAGIEEDDFAQAISEFPYRLPEQARHRYHQLSREALISMITEEPAFAQQEFTRVHRIYRVPDPSPHAPPPADIAPPVRPEVEPSSVIPDAEMEGVVIPPLSRPIRPAALDADSDPDAITEGQSVPGHEEMVSPPSRARWTVIVVLLVLAAGAGGFAAARFFRS